MALPNDADSTQELLEAQALVWNLILNHVNTMSLKCAIQLGIPDVIHKHGKPIMLSQLAHALPIRKEKSDGLRRLMRILVHLKLFDNVKISDNNNGEEEEAYSLTRASHLLRRDEPLSLAPYVFSTTDPILTDPLHHLMDWFRDEHRYPFITKHGKDVWEFARDEPKWNQEFNESMASDARFVGGIVARECKHVFEGLRDMVDVGGGMGAVAKAISDAFPGLKCTVLDLPHVVAGLDLGLENLRFVSGDMFEYIPPADAVFLKWVLHDWSDEECVKILEKCKEAVTPNDGKMIILDIIVDVKRDDNVTESQLCFDMMMLTLCPGKERTEKELANLFYAAGFKSYKITRVFGLRSLIEVFP